MNGYLVMGRCLSDDVPLRLCATLEEAEEFARVLKRDDVRKEAEDIFGVTVSEVECIHIVRFADGSPMKTKAVDLPDEFPFMGIFPTI